MPIIDVIMDSPATPSTASFRRSSCPSSGSTCRRPEWWCWASKASCPSSLKTTSVCRTWRPTSFTWLAVWWTNCGRANAHCGLAELGASAGIKWKSGPPVPLRPRPGTGNGRRPAPAWQGAPLRRRRVTQYQKPLREIRDVSNFPPGTFSTPSSLHNETGPLLQSNLQESSLQRPGKDFGSNISQTNGQPQLAI